MSGMPGNCANDVDKLRRILIPVMPGTPSSASTVMGGGAGLSATPAMVRVPLGELADIRVVKGPTAIKSEEGLLVSYVFVDFSGEDVGGFVGRGEEEIDEPQDSGWVPPDLERRVRAHCCKQQSTEGCDTSHGIYYFYPDFPEYEVHDEDDDCPSGGAFLTRRIVLVFVSAGL